MKKIGPPALEAGELRKKYPTFIYKGYLYELKNGDLHISFVFEMGETRFRPRVIIKNVSQADLKRVGEGALQNLVFHLGLAEMPSYWKATASPKIVIEAGSLNKAQIKWWHGLFMRGMGQYFYENKIDFTKPNFLKIEVSPYSGIRGNKEIVIFPKKGKNRVLLPIGGGKDAIVTYEVLKQAGQNIRPFVLNPKKEQFAILRIADEKNPVIVQRTIDPELLELNRKGYLNGHTPFSSYVAFLTTLCAALFGYKYIALSNERSSNEGNVPYLGHVINHQYSKTFDFEKKFRAYSKKYLAKNVEYFSFLRPLYELQIARIFAKFPKYFPVFLSCNEAHKTNSGTQKPTGKWCGKCAKCIFVFLALYPFAPQQTIGIFKKDLLKDKTLRPLLEKLTGKRSFKPFECVGTIKETRAALSLCLGKIKDHKALHAWNNRHFLPPQFSKLLKRAIL